MVTIKTPEEQKKMRVACRLAADVLDMIGEHVVPGVSTEELDRICHDYIVNVQQAIPANVNYRGFPKTICASVNHVVCHGIPSDKRLKAGDILNIDVTVIRDGFHGDTSRMYFVGKPPSHAQHLSETCHEAMWRGIEVVQPGVHLGDIGHAIQSFVEERHFLGRARILRARHRPRVPRGSAGPALRRAGHRHRLEIRHDLHHRADGERRSPARAPAAGWLDRHHQGPFPLGAVGAHGARYRHGL
jgi:methionine aminopeptidase